MRKKLAIGICTLSISSLFLVFQNFTPSQDLFLPAPGFWGVFDPSLAYNYLDKKTYIAYSSVSPSAMFPTQNPFTVSTHLAATQDGGATWNYVGQINPTLDVNLPLPPPYNAGTWVNEVSSLTYDPFAPANQKWKIMWMHYLLINDVRHFEHGWMGMKMAASPQELITAPELKLFVGAAYDSSNGPALIDVSKLHWELVGCNLFSEPSLLGSATGLYLAMNCVNTGSDQKTIILRNLGDPTKAANWKYQGTALNLNDAKAIGFDQPFTAANLVIAGGYVQLIVTPQTSQPFDNYYRGCAVFRLENINYAKVTRDATGKPIVFNYLPGDVGLFNGACTYSTSTPGLGIIQSQRYFDRKDQFHIYKTGIRF